MNDHNIVDARIEVLAGPGVPGALVERPQGDASAPGEVGSDVAGTSTNRCLPNFASSVRLGDSKPLKPSSKVDVKYLGIDTVNFRIPLSEDDLSNIEPLLLGFVGQGEIKHFDRRFVVSLVKLPYRYRVMVADGMELYVPSKGHAYLGMKVAAGARICLSSDDLEREACEVLGWFLPSDDLAAQLALSRIDVCLDVLIPDRTFQIVCGMVARNSVTVVSRGRKKDTYLEGDRYTGLAVGKEAVRLRAYDKGLKAGKDGTWPMWSEVYADPTGETFEVPDGYVVARFEWQLRREFLAQLQDDDAGFKVRTLADFKKAAPAILEYLCNDWFKLCGPARGGKHERPMLPLWKAVTAAFVAARWSEIEVKVKRVLRRAVAGNEEQLFSMAAGCLASAAAVQGHRGGHDQAKSDAAMLLALRAYIGRDRDNWQATRDRRFKQLAYPAKNTRVYADDWKGQRVPVPAAAAGVPC